MSYRNPRFSYRHMLRSYGALGIDAVNTDAVASGSTANLYDDRSGSLVEWNAAANKDCVLYKNAAATAAGARLGGERLNRILIPKGHTFNNARALRLRASHDLTEVSGATFETSDGVTYQRFAPSSGLFDVTINDDKTVASLLQFRMLTGLVGGSDYGLGELWWTDTVQPTTGTARKWEDNTDALFDRIEVRSGQSYKQKRGESKRRFSHEHLRLSGADLALYDDLFRGTGYGLYPFWYEGPDTGDVETILEDWSDTSGTFTTTNSSTVAPSASRPDGEAGNIIGHSAVLSGVSEWIYPIADSDAPTVDWANKVLRVQVRPDWDSTAVADIKLVVESAVGANTARTEYAVGGCFNQAVSSVWYRLEIDLENDATGFSGSGPADLANLVSFGFVSDFPTNADNTDFGDFILINKDKQPKLVEFADYQRFQDSPVPQVATTYSISMRLLEVTT